MTESPQHPMGDQHPQPGGYTPYPGGAPGPAPTPGVPGVAQPADLGLRFAARLIDFILLFVVYMVVAVMIVAGAIMRSGGGITGGNSVGVSVVTSILGAAIVLGYFAFMESNRGQTVGKMLLKLETRGPDGGKPTLEQAIKRNLFTAVGILGIVPVLGDFAAFVLSVVAVIAIAVTISNNPATRQGWHDKFAGGTTVLKVG